MNIKVCVFWGLGLLAILQLKAASEYCFCTAADSHYFNEVKNLIGSIHKVHYGSEILVYDIGLTSVQKDELNRIENVSVYGVERTNPDIIKSFLTSSGGRHVPGWFAWKPVLIKQSLDNHSLVLYLDAGTVILQPIDQLFKYIKDHGYFMFDTGCPLAPRMTKFLIDKFNLNDPERNWVLNQTFMDASLMGFAKDSAAYRECVLPIYELTRDFDYFKDDGSAPMGFGGARHDQTVFSIFAWLNKLDILSTDYTEKEPTPLQFSDGSSSCIYMTYHPNFVCAKTHIYHCRKGQVANFKQYIHWKK